MYFQRGGPGGLGTLYPFHTNGGNVDLKRYVGVSESEEGKPRKARIWLSYDIGGDLFAADASALSDGLREASLVASAWDDGGSFVHTSEDLTASHIRASKDEEAAEGKAAEARRKAASDEREAERKAARAAEDKRRGALVAEANRLIEAAGGRNPRAGSYHFHAAYYTIAGGDHAGDLAGAAFVAGPGEKWSQRPESKVCRIAVNDGGRRVVYLSFETFAKRYGVTDALKALMEAR